MRKIEIEIPDPADPADAARRVRVRLAASMTATAAGNPYERACARAEAALAVALIARELVIDADIEYAAALDRVARYEKSPGIPLPRYQTPPPGTEPGGPPTDGKAN